MSTLESLSIIVPVYNEAGTVARVIERLRSISFPVPHEVLIVNDGSTDGTQAALDGTPGQGEALRIIHAVRHAGKGAAIRLGLEHARGTIIAIQDADLELDPAQLTSLVAPILKGHAAVVYGSRFLAGRPDAPWLTIAANQLLTGLTNALFGGHLTDMETCYKIMRAEVAHSLRLESNRFDIEPEITAKLLLGGQQILEQPVVFQPRGRADGKKIGWRDGIAAVRTLLKYRLTRLQKPKP